MIKKLRRLALHHQGLTKKNPFGSGKNAVVSAIEHLGYLQIDTLAVVERAHHHTLWARIPKYLSKHLDQAVRDGDVFEYWSHAASYLPMRDYRFALPNMMAIRRGELRYFSKVDKKVMREVYARIKTEGPLKARDFTSAKKASGTWWNWKPAKMALEKLFMQGDLMICDRLGMQKMYDLTDRVLPDGSDTREPSMLEFAEYLIDATLRTHGFATFKTITHLRNKPGIRDAVQTVLQQKIEDGGILVIDIEDMPACYAQPDLFDKKVTVSGANVRILSPFDNFLIHRDRIRQLFGFDYRLECYMPKHKRTFGYFCLPILYQDNLVGSVDCKVHRDEQRFEVIHLNIDKEIAFDEMFITRFIAELYRFAEFNGCGSIVITKVNPSKLQRRFKQAVAAKTM